MNVTITSPFWKQRRDQIVESVIPYQWGVMNDEIATEVYGHILLFRPCIYP